MCTAIRIRSHDAYFGRNLDLNYSFGQQVVFTPRNYAFSFTDGDVQESHYAILGMATVMKDYPLYADAFNEKGLAIAGLNFPGNAVYFKSQPGKNNVSPFELIPFLLSRFSSVEEARPFLEKLNLVDIPFAKEVPLAPLHWILADGKESLVLESSAEGLRIYEDPFDVLTNNPPFPYHRENMKRYRLLSNQEGEARLSKDLDMKPFSVGFGSMFLPGDYSSPSRFAKACYLVKNAAFEDDSDETARRLFFRILESVSFPRGSVLNPDGTYETTLYSACMNLDRRTYSYRTERCDTVTMVRMDDMDLDGTKLKSAPLMEEAPVRIQNL